jgi:hypothetical protein
MNVIKQYLMPLLVGCVVEDIRRLDAPVIRGSRKLDKSLRYIILKILPEGSFRLDLILCGDRKLSTEKDEVE